MQGLPPLHGWHAFEFCAGQQRREGTMLGSYLVIVDNEKKIDRLINETEKSEVMINRYGCEVIGYRIYDSSKEHAVPLLYRDSQPDPPEKGWKNSRNGNIWGVKLF